ncbi:protein translocase subunit SecF [Pelotomaculum terephthalicicum JT]|uniref:protein translocase subunit SecF n=1 Tax=Pelotomaculum TaxID=191373 RepID=UPI0009C489A6|nr:MULTISPECIES: protein translocase subunit SecF [Pelotomaculum]MCG9969821.1 protein translocase subunit SecF [Pelotomaculum terephthalicicum JT]OPX85307.1 MAG: preprotein translocase subunit SecF [Pelotomaculum sp. PtaB.Bin117]OPY62378.1 MAG: preprotein translocase subunit SecF [Pelotomaculum sp. PtaU1.Bin065]
MLRDKKPFHFIKLRKIWYVISILVIVPGIISLFSQGLNLGIDFRGGSLLDLKFNQPTAVEQVRGVLADFGLEGASIQRSGETDFIVRTKELAEDENLAVLQALDQKLGGVAVQRNERVGPVIGQELIRKALLALGVASVLMVVYIAWRFEFKQGIAAIIAILHDVLVILGIFSIFQIEVDSTFVAAVLTIIGYSINDTIVIFDRIRENMLYRKKGEALEDVINNSLWQTMARSINTGLTVIFVLVAFFLMGGATIHNMVLALLIGVSSGAYSSIFNASPIWYDFKKMEERGRLKGAKA